MDQKCRFLRMFLGAGLASAIVLGAGCAKKDSNEIAVGEYGSLSGAQATFGQTTHEGILLAVNQTNAAGGIKGRQIRLISRDTRSDPGETKTVVTRLISSDGVAALLGEVASGKSLIAAPLAQQAGIPMISPSSTNPDVTKVGDMIFRACVIDPDQGYIVASFCRAKLGAAKAAILFDQTQPYSVGLRDNFRESFTKLGGTIITEQPYSGGSNDYSTQINNITAMHPDVVFVPGYYNEVSRIAIQARAAGLTVPLIGCDGWETPGLAKLAEGNLEGCYYSNHYAPEDKRPESVAFVTTYTKAYGHPPGALAALGYDAAMILFDAMKRAPSLSGADLAKAISQTDYQGVTGRSKINTERNAVKPMVILQIRNGTPTYVTTIYPPGLAPPTTAPQATRLVPSPTAAVEIRALPGLSAVSASSVRWAFTIGRPAFDSH